MGFDSVSLSVAGPQVRHPFLLFPYPYITNLKSDGIAVRTIQGLAFRKTRKEPNTLVESLREQGIIDKSVFAFHIADQPSEGPISSLSLGSFNLSKYALEKDFAYFNLFDVYDNGLWSLRLLGFSLSKASTAIIGIMIVEIVSDINYIKLPTEAFELYCLTVSSGPCDMDKESFGFNCENGEEELWPDLIFVIDKVTITIPPKFYITKNGNMCMDLVRWTPYIYKLGMPFLRAYYTLFDMDNHRIGIARSVNYPYPSIWSRTTLLVICLAVVAIIAVGIGCYLLYRKRNPEVARNPPLVNPMEPLLRLGEEY